MHIDNNIALKILIGSQNYNLDEKDSDFDYKYFLAPTYDQIYENHKLTRESKYDNGIIFYKSLKDLPSMLIEKSSFSNLELIISREIIVDPRAQPLVDMLIRNYNRIVYANLPKLYNSTMGEIKQRIRSIERDKYTEGTKHFYDKYGYDTKEAMHTFRLINLLNRVLDMHVDRKPLDDDFLYHSKQERGYYLTIKHGFYTKTVVLQKIRQFESELLARKKDTYSVPQFTLTNDLKSDTYDLTKRIIQTWYIS